jgi:NTE family protein
MRIISLCESLLISQPSFTLVLGGGNALGAYHLGACQQMLLAGMAPDRIVGASIGAVTGAILLGNPPERRLERLAAFWEHAASPVAPLTGAWREARARQTFWFGLDALITGRPGLFRGALPRLPALASLPHRALNDHRPLVRTLERLVDFGRLNASEIELQLVTLDVETGEEVWFSNREGDLAPEHLLAATAFPLLYPAIEVGGRLLCDAGLANNLPIDRAFELDRSQELLCIAVDLFSLSHDRPEALDGMLARAQDIVFASQASRSISAIARERALIRRLDPSSPAAVLAHVAFRAPAHQRGLKTVDYSRASIRERAEQGRSDMAAMLGRIAAAPWDQPLVLLR